MQKELHYDVGWRFITYIDYLNTELGFFIVVLMCHFIKPFCLEADEASNEYSAGFRKTVRGP